MNVSELGSESEETSLFCILAVHFGGFDTGQHDTYTTQRLLSDCLTRRLTFGPVMRHLTVELSNRDVRRELAAPHSTTTRRSRPHDPYSRSSCDFDTFIERDLSRSAFLRLIVSLSVGRKVCLPVCLSVCPSISDFFDCSLRKKLWTVFHNLKLFLKTSSGARARVRAYIVRIGDYSCIDRSIDLLCSSMCVLMDR